MRAIERIVTSILDIVEVIPRQHCQSSVRSYLLYQSALDIKSLHGQALAESFLNAIAAQAQSVLVSNGLNRHRPSAGRVPGQ